MILIAHLVLILAGALAIWIATRRDVAGHAQRAWPKIVVTQDGEIVVHRDGTVEWQSGDQFRPLRVVAPSYWEGAN